MKQLRIKNYELGIICFLFSVCNLLAQDYEPTPITFSFGTYTNVNLSPDLHYFKQNKFLLEWQWGGGKRISQALNINEIHHDVSLSASEIVDTCDIICIQTYATHCYGSEKLNARGVHYEPTLKITNPGVFQTRAGDNTNPVFGFKQTRGQILPLSDSSNQDYSRLIIEGDSLKDSVILSDPWPDNELYTYGGGHDSTFDKYLCVLLPL
ncbi:hypothetical protein D9V86_02000 [Bacteroidetes/Chlorobi group bacterium ChocPot_Mid]|nr:MAG: hypothetical protein D9V86_02000 [Bacteroidetes/Chlorobi group bacterium ChocPot_Mid]